MPRLWASRRVAYLLDEIRLHGENAELKNEATDLARQFGLVTPYTAYLIMEDEQRPPRRGGKPGHARFRGRTREASSPAAAPTTSFKHETDGSTAVSRGARRRTS